MNSKLVILLSTVVAVAVALYIAFVEVVAINIVKTGSTFAVVLGISIIVIATMGIWSTLATLRSGFRMQKLTNKIKQQGLMPNISGLPRTASGKISRPAADALFEQLKKKWEIDPELWQSNYLIACAYDIAGDRKRAREFMKKAINLESRSNDSK